jgi:hypothetical protein
VALERTVTLDDPSKVLIKSTSKGVLNPEIPNSIKVFFIQDKASAWIFGAFCALIGA